jgi:hypothetical protein
MQPMALCVLATFPLCASSLTQTPVVPNAGFEEGAAGAPQAWRLSEGVGGWDEGGRESARCVSVTGTGEDSNFWRTDELQFAPGQTYRVSAWIRTAPGTSGGCIITGPTFANRDYNVGEQWERRAFVFRTPDAAGPAYVRFGQWMVRGQVFFDDVGLVPVQPLNRRTQGVELGDGETIDDGRYSARLRFGYEGSNYSRCLYRAEAGFNSNRWTLGGGASVVYRHRIEGYAQESASCRIRSGHYQSGALIAEASEDAEDWTEIGRLQEVGQIEATVPDALLPADEVYIRFRCAPDDEGNGSLQVHGYEYMAALDGDPPDAGGATIFVELRQPSDRWEVVSLGDLLPGGDNRVELLAKGTGQPVSGTLTVAVTPQTGEGRTYSEGFSVSADGSESLAVTYEVLDTGAHSIAVAAREERGGDRLFEAQAEFSVAELYASDFGYLISEDDAAALWWAEGPYKISRERPAPQQKGPRLLLEAARNEYEPVQLVIRPQRDLRGLTAQVSDLSGPGNASMAADAMRIDRVEYVNVRVPTDSEGCEGWWPDPLPPVDGPFDAKAGRNHPLWITVHVPKDARAGRYDGTVSLNAEGWKAEVPLALRVFDFALPDETHLQSGFGLSSGSVRQYHNLETDEELRQVFDLYLQNFAAHRISPYDPMQLDPITVEWTGMPWTGGEVDREEKASGQASIKVEDANDTATIDVHTTDLMPVDPQIAYVFRWACKTALDGQDYLVTLQTYDANEQWLSGRNIDLAATGTGEWTTEERSLAGRFTPEARYARLVLRPVPWTEDGQHTGTAWFDDIALQRADGGPDLIPNPGFENLDQQGDVRVDFSAFDQAAQRAFDELHMNSFRLRIEGMGGGTFHSRHYGRIGPYMQGTPEYERLMTKYLHTLEEHLAAKGWLDKAYIYWFDEPTAQDYDFVTEGMELLERCGPRLRRMLTEEPTPPLFGAVDVWCPVVPNMDPTVCAQRQEKGEQIWWYVCTGPKAPFTTLFIDHNAIEMRMWVWMTWKWNIQGILIWATNYWTSPLVYHEGVPQNPWEDPMSYQSGYGLPVGHVGYWGNGDGRFVYPPNGNVGEDKTKHLEGPVNCIRWEMLRDGIEDYEYLHLLRDLVAKAGIRRRAVRQADLLLIPEEIIADKTDFTRDPQPLLEHRRKVAEAIEQLQDGKG